jgi:hypothetical protein
VPLRDVSAWKDEGYDNSPHLICMTCFIGSMQSNIELDRHWTIDSDVAPVIFNAIEMAAQCASVLDA